MLDEVDGLAGFAAESYENVGRHVGMFGKAGQCTIQLIVVRPVVLHRAAGLVRDGHHAIDIGVLLDQIGSAETLRDVLAGAGGTIDGAYDGDVVARPVTAVPT